MKAMRHFSILLAFILLVGVFAGCTTPADPATVPNEPSTSGDETVVCYSFGVMSGGPAWGQFQKGFYAACEEIGWEGHYLSPTTDNDMNELFNLHDTAISNGADVMLPCVTDAEAMADILQRAVDQGIPMVGINQADPHFPAMIGTDNTNLGHNIANALVQCMGDKEIHVVTMQTILAHQGQTDQVDAFVEKLMELRPDAEVVRREECGSSAQVSQDKLSAICLANPQANCFVSFDCYAGLGAATYVESEGLQDEFTVIGIDDAVENFQCMKDGTMAATVAQMWYNMGYKAVMLAKDLKNGEDIPALNDSGAAIIMPDEIDTWIEENDLDYEV